MRPVGQVIAALGLSAGVLLAPLSASGRSMPDAGLFEGSAIGRQLAGEGVAELASQWVEGLGEEPLLARAELEGSSGAALSFYQQIVSSPDAGPFEVKRVKRFDFGDARIFERMQTIDLGAQGGAALMLVMREDVPDDPAVRCLIVGADLKVLYKESLVDNRPEGRDLSLTDRPVGFSWIAEPPGFDNPVLEVDQGSVWVPLKGPGGELSVEIGRHRSFYGRKNGSFVQIAKEYVDLLAPRKLSSPGHAKLVDGKPSTFERLKVGASASFDLGQPGGVMAIRILTGCPESSRSSAGGQAMAFKIKVGDRVMEAHRTEGSGAGLLGVGEFTAGASWASQELIFFDPPMTGSNFTLELTQVDPPGQSACISEVTAHSGVLQSN